MKKNYLPKYLIFSIFFKAVFVFYIYIYIYIYILMIFRTSGIFIGSNYHNNSGDEKDNDHHFYYNNLTVNVFCVCYQHNQFSIFLKKSLRLIHLPFHKMKIVNNK